MYYIVIIIITVTLAVNHYATGIPAAQQSYWNYTYPKEYFGTVWIKITPSVRDIGKNYNYEIIWGPWKYNNDLNFTDSLPVYLKHTKKADLTDFAISFSLMPSCYADVSFGQEEIKDNTQNIIDINKGWTSLDDQRVKFIYQTFDSIGDLWSWDNGTVERTLENTLNGSKVLKLTTHTSFGGCGIQCENGSWDVDIIPDNMINSSILSFFLFGSFTKVWKRIEREFV